MTKETQIRNRKSKIENPIGWCDETTNAVTGCDKVSPGCKNCYAEAGTRARVLRAQGIETWGAKGVRHPVNFEPVFRRLNNIRICDKCHRTAPLKTIDEKCNGKPYGESGPFCDGRLRRPRLFADSNSDWMDGKWEIQTLCRFLYAIFCAPNIDVLLLTKRPENFRKHLEHALLGWGVLHACEFMDRPGFFDWLDDWRSGTPPENVWVGVSVENQAMADLRIPQLLAIPAAVRFLSCEPLLEAVDLSEHLSGAQMAGDGAPRQHRPTGIDWVIVGGESGKNRRDCGVRAIELVAWQCMAREVAVPVYVKQDCALLPGQQGRIPDAVWGLKQFPKTGQWSVVRGQLADAQLTP